MLRDTVPGTRLISFFVLLVFSSTEDEKRHLQGGMGLRLVIDFCTGCPAGVAGDTDKT